MKILLPFDQSASSEHAIRFLEGYRGEKASATPVLLNIQSPSIEFWASMSEPLLEKALLEVAERITSAAFILGIPSSEIRRRRPWGRPRSAAGRY
jgi:hypothetical protein